MAQSLAIRAVFCVALFIFVSVASAQYAIPSRMLPIPAFPHVGDVAYLYVIDHSPAFPGSGPFVYVRAETQVQGVVRAGGFRSAQEIFLQLGALPAGKYRADYFDLPNAPGPTDVPKLSIEFFISQNGSVDVVEYYNATLDHYFMTADPGEIASLDRGATPGWRRTGESFHALPTDQIPSYGQPVCRFYGLPEYGLDSHFFPATREECATVAEKWPDRWKLETLAAFGTLVDIFPFDCSDTMRPVYRLYNNRADANHRYTISPAIRNEMMAKGWVLEAFDHYPWEEPYTMCVPQ